MLTKQDFQQNLRFISFGCNLAAYPLQVDLKNGKLKLVDRKPMGKLCWLSFGGYTIHVSYIALRLPYLLLTGAKIPLLSLLLHFTLLLVTPIVAFVHYTAFFRWPVITVTCFNRIFETEELEATGNVTKTKPLTMESVFSERY